MHHLVQTVCGVGPRQLCLARQPRLARTKMCHEAHSGRAPRPPSDPRTRQRQHSMFGPAEFERFSPDERPEAVVLRQIGTPWAEVGTTTGWYWFIDRDVGDAALRRVEDAVDG